MVFYLWIFGNVSAHYLGLYVMQGAHPAVSFDSCFKDVQPCLAFKYLDKLSQELLHFFFTTFFFYLTTNLLTTLISHCHVNYDSCLSDVSV